MAGFEWADSFKPTVIAFVAVPPELKYLWTVVLVWLVWFVLVVQLVPPSVEVSIFTSCALQVVFPNTIPAAAP